MKVSIKYFLLTKGDGSVGEVDSWRGQIHVTFQRSRPMEIAKFTPMCSIQVEEQEKSGEQTVPP